MHRDHIGQFEAGGRFLHEEIDIVATGEQELYLFEVKWRNLGTQETIRIVEKLKKKAEDIDGDREKIYGVIAKRIEEKNELRKRFMVWDLEDFDELKEGNERPMENSPKKVEKGDG